MIVLPALAMALGGAAGWRLVVGPDGIDPPRDSLEWSLRLGRILAAGTVGSALAAAGVMLQSLLRNPLAAPSVLGLTAGASLGVTIATFLGVTTLGAMGGAAGSSLAALLGAGAALLLVYSLAQRRGALEPVSLILVGVVVSLICGAGMVLLQHLMPDQGLAATTRWLFGSIRDDLPRALLQSVFILTMVGILIGIRLGPAMDASALDDDEAMSVGVPLERLRVALFSIAGALTAGSVVLAGPIGFVGLICPHATRLLVGPGHRVVLVGSALLGAALLISADALIRVIDLGAGRMPVGVLTTLVGGPAFLWLLRTKWVQA